MKNLMGYSRTWVTLLPLVTVGIASGCSSPAEPHGSGSVTIEAVTPVNITGTVVTNVAVQPSVRVRDRFGDPLPGTWVTFHTAPGSGSIYGAGALGSGDYATARTDADGIASAGTWFLGKRAGAQTLTAQIGGGTRPVTFTATAEPGPVARLVRVGGNNQTGIPATALSNPLRVKVRDAFGNSVPRAQVFFDAIEGDGRPTRSSPAQGAGSPGAPASGTQGDAVLSDANGVATYTPWILGPSAGMQRVRAQSDTAQTVFTARACAPDAAAACDVFAEYKLHSQSGGARPYPGSLTLYSDGSFSIHHGELAGGGDYTVAGSTVVFNYTDKFLLELSAEYDVWSFSYSTVEETGSMSENLISLRRCYTEDCWESTWVYQTTGSP